MICIGLDQAVAKTRIFMVLGEDSLTELISWWLPLPYHPVHKFVSVDTAAKERGPDKRRP